MCYIRVMSDEKYIVPKREMYPSSVFNDELLKDALDPGAKLSRHLLCNAAFKTKPESNLVACLSSYTKNYLLELAKDHELNIAKSTRKDELVKTLSERIVERFPKMLPYLPKVNLEFLTRFNTENNILNIKVDELEFRDISHAHNFGFLFLYYDKKDFFAVVPAELIETLSVLKRVNLAKSLFKSTLRCLCNQFVKPLRGSRYRPICDNLEPVRKSFDSGNGSR